MFLTKLITFKETNLTPLILLILQTLCKNPVYAWSSELLSDKEFVSITVSPPEDNQNSFLKWLIFLAKLDVPFLFRGTKSLLRQVESILSCDINEKLFLLDKSFR